MDDQRFTAACQAAATAHKGMGGIGTLGERTLHMVLKRYMEPDERLHEIKPFATHPNFSLCVAMLELEELRYQNGWSRDGKRGSERCDRIPLGLVGEVVFQAPKDYRTMLPANLPIPFLVKDFKRAAKLSRHQAGLAVDTLRYIGAIRVVAKEKNAFVYE